jgi:hypothetical protein
MVFPCLVALSTTSDRIPGSFIGWSRVCRPGTVHGNQQQYLVNLEPWLLGVIGPRVMGDWNSQVVDV